MGWNSYIKSLKIKKTAVVLFANMNKCIYRKGGSTSNEAVRVCYHVFTFAAAHNVRLLWVSWFQQEIHHQKTGMVCYAFLPWHATKCYSLAILLEFVI